MKSPYMLLAVIFIIAYNGILIKRDQELFKAHDRACAELPSNHPDCSYTK